MTETAGYSIQMIARYTHVSCVILTFILFFVRGIWMIGAPDRLRRPWVRRLPPVIDTLLLASAIVLAISIHQYPLVNGWLTAKVIGIDQTSPLHRRIFSTTPS